MEKAEKVIHILKHLQDKPHIFHRVGEKGLEIEVILELKLIADVGLLGFPNVGKSTILSVVTSATPKIADYHFTTLEPNLGVVKTEYGDSFVIADIPGIIEGASQGVGLGLQFLRHIERTRLLLHVVDASGLEGRNPIEDFYKINEELTNYSKKLTKRTQILVANKVDLVQESIILQDLKALASKEDIEFFEISAATGEGIKDLFVRVSEVLKLIPKEEIEDSEERIVYTLKEEDEFDIVRQNGEFIVSGPAVDRLMNRINVQDTESLAYFQRVLEDMGVNEKLRKMGVKAEDTIRLNDWEFEWYD